jgi:hypothetical protein
METEKPVCRLTRAAVRSKYELNYLSTMRTIGPAIEWQTSEGCQREHPRLYFAESVLLAQAEARLRCQQILAIVDTGRP